VREPLLDLPGVASRLTWPGWIGNDRDADTGGDAQGLLRLVEGAPPSFRRGVAKFTPSDGWSEKRTWPSPPIRLIRASTGSLTVLRSKFCVLVFSSMALKACSSQKSRILSISVFLGKQWLEKPIVACCIICPLLPG